MKLRRAMVAAAATAVIAPLTLLSAPVAFATDETPNTSTSTPAAEESTPAADTSTPAAEESTPAADESSPAADESTPAADESTPAADESTPAADESTPAADESTPAASASPSPSASAPGDEDPELCVDENGDSTAELSAEVTSGLSGLPETIVAGSGWTAFSFNVSNRGDDEVKDIKPLIGVAAIGWEDAEDYSGQIKVQVFDKASGSWETIAGAAGEGGTFDAFSLGAGQSVSYKLRLSVSGKVPDALGVTGGLAEYADDEGCWVADDPNGWLYFFDVLAAGSDAGDPNDAKPQTGGMADLSDVNQVSATGTLAETGSSSALPMIGLVGGAAVVAGAGAVFVVRRRKAGAEA
ncbi:LAETG motif-containing sortase-dependent surface protein [Streptomyces sp. ALI-76-A]|jgi:LPXTG-motif cell wall-anchored protein|uniref:LAETG motif-containing sortase-dependent surface protein n=1 Tax=Streptomyces sp. ALI-76-A TaxID=3025736 RepID=UPI00256F2101|nr:LAETG motif-containing sortase-dependent surface protein [Streptomyces sp. ALI-76-A]MDL5203320.1 LAETG motif-containing sortase-dependent surface protein [Streptomyces sp. ALI-76-A]